MCPDHDAEQDTLHQIRHIEVCGVQPSRTFQCLWDERRHRYECTLPICKHPSYCQTCVYPLTLLTGRSEFGTVFAVEQIMDHVWLESATDHLECGYPLQDYGSNTPLACTKRAIHNP